MKNFLSPFSFLLSPFSFLLSPFSFLLSPFSFLLIIFSILNSISPIQSQELLPICGLEGVLPDTLPSGVFSAKPAEPPTIFVSLYIHNCLHPDGSGGLTQQELDDMIQTTVNDFMEHDIVIRAELCEEVILDDPNDPHFEETDETNFEAIAAKYGCHTNGIDVFILPDDFVDNELFGSSSVGGGRAVGIPARTLFLFGHINCRFPALYQYQGVQGVGPHVATVPHFLSHEIGHCLGLAHTHDDQAFYGNVPNLWFCVDETCTLTTTTLVSPCPSITVDPQTFPYFGNPTFIDNIMAYTNYYDCDPGFTSKQGDQMYTYLLNDPELANIGHDERNGDLNITQPTVWQAADFFPGGKVTFNGSITISSGGSLTIDSGVEVRFPEGEGIVVEQGGVLNLYGYLGPACCAPWEGVRVMGTPNVVPGPATHGRFFGSGGVIEYAKTGVMSLNGGCIETDNGMTFNNNGTGVFFGIFSQHGVSSDLLYISGLRNTNFNTTDYKRAVESPLGWNMKCHVLVSSYQGSNELLSINKCNFQNTVWNEKRTRCGILTFDSEQYIDYNKFSNFESAIYSFNLFGSLSVITPSYIKFNQFERNNISVYNRRMPLSIAGNNFDLSNIYLLTSNLPNSGLIVADLYAYFGVFATGNTETLDVSANNFYNIPPSPPLPFPLRTTTGVYVQDLGSSSQIFEWYNGFSGLSYGNIAEGINSGWGTVIGTPPFPPLFVPTGFHYLCNENTDNDLHDFAVATGGSVRNYQGELAAQLPITINPAKNTFSHFDLATNQSDFLNLGLPIQYYYLPSAVNQEPLDYSANTIFLVDVPGAIETCVPRIAGDTVKEVITQAQMLQLKEAFYSTKVQMDTVALQFIDASASADTTAMNSLHIIALAYRTQMDNAIYGILGYYSMLGEPKDSLRLWTSRYGRIESEYRIARDYIHENNASAADSILALVPQKFSLSSSRVTELAALRTMLPLLAGKNIYQLDSVTLQALAVYDDSTLGYTADLAQSIRMGNGIFAPIRFVLPQGEGAGQRSMEHAGKGIDGNNDPQSGFLFYPNPSDNKLTVKYPAHKVDLQMEVYDLLGRLQHVDFLPANAENKLINTASWNEGLYFIRVVSSEKQLTAARILIKH